MSIYLDNAATTALDPKVLETMMPYLQEHHGNSSSTHTLGRTTKGAVEQSRKKIAELLGVTPAEIVFTSGGTEADNLTLRGAVRKFAIQHAVTSKLEHHAVLHTLEDLAEEGKIELHFVQTLEDGSINLNHLEEFLSSHPNALISLMHGNNEIGNLLDLKAVGTLAEKYDAVFHSDTVQTMGHFPLNLRELGVHYAVASAHKFHGPKGVGFAFICKDHKVCAQQTGGSQERGLRGGTHNVAGIVGLTAALEIAIQEQDAHRQHILRLKQKLRKGISELVPGAIFHGASSDLDNSLYTVLNVGFPDAIASGMLLFQLDIQGVCASGGSACSSGAVSGSHVIQEVGQKGYVPVRFSFGKYNTEAEIEQVLKVVKGIVTKEGVSA